MRAFLDELEATLNCGIWSPVVLGLLVIPDACGAVEYSQLKNGDRYRKWYDTWVDKFVSQYVRFDGEVMWKLRNSMMHEASLNLASYGYDRALFTPPSRSGNIIHMAVTSDGGGSSESALTIYLPSFFNDIKLGVQKGLDCVDTDSDPSRRERMDGLIQLRPQGLAPHIVGLPLVS